LQIEATIVKGNGKVTLTGKLGEVMQESAKTALTCVQTRAKQLGINEEDFAEKDLHIHVPEGAIPKDGPSAGITMATAMVSALTGRKFNHDVAMTGEITLRGKVLPIGGLKEKLLAAHRYGLKTIIISKANEKDLADVPEEVRDDLQIHLVEMVDEVLEIALNKEKSSVMLETPQLWADQSSNEILTNIE
jgi:ATP-dependent Lon protease